MTSPTYTCCRSASYQKPHLPNLDCLSSFDGQASLGVSHISIVNIFPIHTTFRVVRHLSRPSCTLIWLSTHFYFKRAILTLKLRRISGTPIQNRLDELFPYFKFLRVRHTGSIAVFRQNFCLKDSDVCNKRLHSMLEGLMIRRTHQNKLFGVPLVQLPKNTQATIPLKFTAVEMAIYQRVKARCIRAINA